jgi:hypothetical protein
MTVMACRFGEGWRSSVGTVEKQRALFAKLPMLELTSPASSTAGIVAILKITIPHTNSNEMVG